MGMSTHVVGIKPADEKFNQMRSLWEACEKARVTIPLEVVEFFGGETPDEAGVIVDLENAVQPWRDDSADGYEVDITKLPKDVKIIRFYNSW
jgi:type IV secretory pathway TraG/TraD family ATPase VirD4